jgi:two-component system, NtrC family, sensor kinase
MIAIVIVTEAFVSIALVNRAIRDSRADLHSNARSLSAALSLSLRDPLLRDDVWQAFEIVRMPLHSLTQTDPLREILTFDQNGRIFAASDPFRYQTATHVSALTDIVSGDASSVIPPLFKLLDPDEPGLNRLVALNPIQADDGSVLGMVAILYDSEIFTERSLRAIQEVIWLSFPGMLILIPLAWFLGGRLALPLSQLSESISRIGQDSAASIRNRLPPP